MKKLHTLLLALCALGLTTQAHAGAAKTTYPVVFAHGMAGFDDILGYDYWGDDYGMFVGDVCGLFDRSGYESHFDSNSRTIWIKGGVRGRVYFRGRTWDGPALNKIPLIYVSGERLYLKSSHQVWPLSLNLGEMRGAVGITGALLHFKFLSSFLHTVADAANRSEHTAEYTMYASPEDARNFVYTGTSNYSHWQDLSDNGLLQGEGWQHWRSASDAEVRQKGLPAPGIAAASAQGGTVIAGEAQVSR